jgi:hypothetical protein
VPNSGDLTMRALVVQVAALCGIAMSSLAANAAQSEERLVMPFACQDRGGEVALVPGPSQSYRIYGTPERQLFTACSPKAPEICRNWLVHRFDIDCSGVRVSWLSVVDALTRRSGSRFWVSDGRLHVKMGPWWNRTRGGPCYIRRPSGYAPWRYGRPDFDGPCASAPPDSPQQVIDMPSGFAPVVGPFAHFTSEPSGQPEPVERPAPQVNRAAGGLPKEERRPDMQTANLEPSVSKAGQTFGSAEARSLMAGASVARLPKRREATTNEVSPGGQAPVAPLWGKIANNVWFGLVATLLISAMWLVWARRDDRMDVTTVSQRETKARASTGFTPNPFRPQPSAPIAPSAEVSERLPSTRKEALQVLGASPETGEEMLKKIVKTLRQNWHPDRATREEERLMRERRLKQINVAWDIIRGKQASAKGSSA